MWRRIVCKYPIRQFSSFTGKLSKRMDCERNDEVKEYDIKEGSVIIRFPNNELMKDDVEDTGIIASDGARRNTKNVFYNVVQEFNRDMSVLVLRRYLKELLEKSKEKEKRKNDDKFNGINVRILEAFSATGLRSLRYAKECLNENEKEIDLTFLTNDISMNAVRSIRHNCELNNIKSDFHPNYSIDENIEMKRSKKCYYENRKCIITCDDANELMLKLSYDIDNISRVFFPHNHHDGRTSKKYMRTINRHKYDEHLVDVIDIDPYGSPGPFLQSTMKCLKKSSSPIGSLLMVTATDAAVLCGSAGGDASWARYGTVTAPKMPYCHETAIRSLLYTISRVANDNDGCYIEPIVSMYSDFYIRLFLLVKRSPVEAKKSAQNIGYSFICTNCTSYHIQPLMKVKSVNTNTRYEPTNIQANSKCEICGSNLRITGPFWIASINNSQFIQNLIDDNTQLELSTKKRIAGRLSLLQEELDDVPFFYLLNQLSKTFRCRSPTINEIRSALLSANYRVSFSHCEKSSLKTNASSNVMMALFHQWIEENPNSVKKDKIDSLSHIYERVGKFRKEHPEIKFDFSYNSSCESKTKLKGLNRYPVNPEPFWGPMGRPK
ncbi:hypothetical protein SNEBB_005167 [Seison nebaliae]|nr:hypothetical protein SNEBB_005167 [Seison nebaliae]